MLDLCLAYFRVDNFNVDGCIIEVNNLPEISYFKTIPLWIKKYKPIPNPPIVSLLESQPDVKLKLLLVIPTDTLLIIPNQETQLVGVLKVLKEAIK